MLRWGRMLLLLLAVSPTNCTLGRLFRPRPVVVVNGAILTGHPARHTMRYIQRNPRFMQRFRNRGPSLAAGVSLGGGIFRKTIRMLTPAFNLAHTRISLVFQAPTIQRLDGFLNEVVDDIHSTQNRELEDDIDLSETFNTAFNESDGQLAPPPRHPYRPPHRRPGNNGPYGPGGPGHGRPNGPDHGRPHGPGNGRPHGPDNGRPHGPGNGRPHGPDNGRPHGSDYGRPGGSGHGRPHGDGYDRGHSTPWDDPYGMNITIASPIVANEIKLLNASIYVAVVRLVIPLSQGGLNANATAAGHARVRAASGNFSAAITSLNNLRKTVDPKNKHARDLDEASNRLIDDMDYMNKLLRNDGNQGEIAELVAKMIYDSVPVLNSLVLADVPPDRISAFFLNVIEGIVSVVVGETMLMASNRSNSMNDVVEFINTALKPLTISASYSTMSEPDLDGDQGGRGSGREYDPPPSDRDTPRNTLDRENGMRPPGNGDLRNDIVRNDRNQPPGEESRPMNDARERPFDDRDRPRQYSNNDPGRSRYRDPRGGNSRERDYPRDNPRGVDRRNWDDPRARGDAQRRPWDDQRYRNEPRRRPWDDPRYGDRSRQEPWNSPRAADTPRQGPWNNPPTADYPRQESWNDPSADDNVEQDPWNTPAVADDADPDRWNDPGAAYNTRTDPSGNQNDANDAKENPWNNSWDQPRATGSEPQDFADDTRRAYDR